MGRLNSGGSSTSLRRSLFPEGFAGLVMSHLLETWQTFSLHRRVQLENEITALFCDALKEAYVVAGRNWIIVPEYPITDPIRGIQLKRLRVHTKSGLKHLADKYVEKGLQRFVDGKYSADHPCGGMLGYVMDNCLDEAFNSIQCEIHKRRSVLKMKKKNSICVPSRTAPSHLWSLDTFHRRSDGELTVHHLLVGVAR